MQCPYGYKQAGDDSTLFCMRESGHEGQHADTYEVYGSTKTPKDARWYNTEPCSHCGRRA